MVPLLILCRRKPVASNPRNVHIRELFTRPPEKEHHYFWRPGVRPGFLARVFRGLDRFGRMLDAAIPAALRERATRRAEAWMIERLNGEHGLGAIFPAMVNALEALAVLGYASDALRRLAAKRAFCALLVVHLAQTPYPPSRSPLLV